MLDNTETNASRPVLELSGVAKSFGPFSAVKEINLHVEKNQLVTLLGPSGCGKTTTLRMIAGFEYPTSGQICIDGQDVTYAPPNKREIGIVFQSYSLFPHLSVADNVAYGLRRRGVAKKERIERVRETLELVDLAQLPHRYPTELSGGQQQRVALARAIVIRPKILLLDEPLSALDAKLREKMRFEIRRLQRQIGMTTVLVTHDQEEALAMSDRIVVMNQGHVEQEGTPTAIYQNPKTPFVASFIGETNLLEGEILGRADAEDSLRFRSNCGLEFSIRSPGRLEPGERALVSLRPESLVISAPEADRPETPNVIRGTVLGVSYLGARTVFEIKTPTRDLLVSVQNDANQPTQAHKAFSEGQEIALSWAPTACQVVEVR